ncbi:hypothetical protein HPP92_023317 [Vanilla planifolia]|uniref:ZCF37 n=1 Tax=Vanilla planifolia TaxID=51239 RepID=A0A835PUY3_VANPL|nr:hypothetical protein HPP92_023317 [Vanilla planifolia]
MFCGASSFPNVDEDPSSSPPTPKQSKKKQSNNKNPYSSRGLDKFSSVVSELEARREKIMAKTGTQGVAMVRFMSSNSRDWIPIIVRVKDDDQNQIVNRKKAAPQLSQPKPKELPNPTPQPPPPPEKLVEEKVVKAAEAMPEKGVKQSIWKWRSSYNVPAGMVLILLSLVMFGRVFAICCTSIWWYLMPMLMGQEESRSSRRKSSKKKVYLKKPSDKILLAAGMPAASQGKKLPAAGVAQELSSPRFQAKRGL